MVVAAAGVDDADVGPGVDAAVDDADEKLQFCRNVTVAHQEES